MYYLSVLCTGVIRPGHAKDASRVILRVLACYGYGQLISKLDVVWLTVIYSNLWKQAIQELNSSNGLY